MKEVIVVASGKGGTGKSTVTVGLGTALADEGYKVLLVDCDSGMRGLDIMLGITRSLVFDIADAVSGSCTVENTVYPCPNKKGLFLMPAPLNAYDEVAPQVLGQLVDGVADIFDYIIVDSPAGVGSGFEAAAYPATRALVVVNTEPTSLRGGQNVARKLTECGVSDIRLVINKFNRKTFEKMALYEDLDEVIDVTALQLIAVIPEDYALAAAIQSGKIGTASKASNALSRLAGRIQGRKEPLLIK
ncbi:MAG: AAA family ATPase [Lachnospiraceae bacterium]|nr:AAA family ATPase [Lachnospiraceae bacterium]